MSYVWTPEQVERYFGYYEGLTTRNSYTYLTFETTREFARSVLPPCLEPAENPTITVSSMAFMEVSGDFTNRVGRDRCAMIHINARYGDLEGVYYLSVLETEEVNLETGREIWGMPKKLATIDSFDDGERVWAFVERKNYRIIEFEADLGPEQGPQPGVPEYYFELHGGFTANGFTLNSTELLIFKLGSVVNRFRELTNPLVHLAESPFDPGIATIPLGEFVEGGLMGGETAYDIVEVRDLSSDGNDYAPYILGRLYDDWPDLRVTDNRRSSRTRV